MFKFFTNKKWHLWSIGGTLLILAATWYQVQLDVRINEWFGEFYDTLSELKLEFSSKELAISYAKKKKINYEIIEPKKRKTIKKSYADNFLR